jgi:hypothetical protein
MQPTRILDFDIFEVYCGQWPQLPEIKRIDRRYVSLNYLYTFLLQMYVINLWHRKNVRNEKAGLPGRNVHLAKVHRIQGRSYPVVNPHGEGV